MGVKFREKLGVMPQYPGIYPNFTIEKYLWYMATLKGLKKDDAARQIAEVLEAVELADLPNRKVWEVTCKSEAVAKLQQTYRVINIAQTDTGVILRVLSEATLEGDAKAVTPTLEDYYLWVFGESGS